MNNSSDCKQNNKKINLGAARIEPAGEKRIRISKIRKMRKGGSRWSGLLRHTVDGDASEAAFLDQRRGFHAPIEYPPERVDEDELDLPLAQERSASGGGGAIRVLLRRPPRRGSERERSTGWPASSKRVAKTPLKRVHGRAAPNA